MHPLHDYVAKQLADKLRDRRIVVWYDERGEFRPFVDEVRGAPRAASQPMAVSVAGTKASLAEYAGSLFELRAVVEPLVSGDQPDTLVVYIPGLAHDAKASVLMELEKAGRTWKPELKQLARNVLLQKYTLGVVDEMLPFDRKVSYEDLARAAAGNSGAEPPSILKSIFHDASGNDGLLAAWLASDARDQEIASKEATRELTKLVKALLGLDLVGDSPLAKLRAIALRYVLAGEFRLDLACDDPASLDGIARPATKDEESAVRQIARRLRAGHADAYAALADRIEAELGLRQANVPAAALGSIDTFRFEERALLAYAGQLIADGRFGEASALVADREHSFWLDRDVGRKAQWEAARRMAELGALAGDVLAAVRKATGSASDWLHAYSTKDGWARLDQAQRRLEAWVANLDEEPEERPLGVVRRAYEDACQAMADGFSRALMKAGWTVSGVLHQTQIWSEVAANKPKPVAYLLVDAMRFEMGAELAERMPSTSEVSVRAAVAALPSITPVGMAALMPGASASFSVVEHGNGLAGKVDGVSLSDLPARKRFASARVPNLVDLTLDEVLSLPKGRLAKKLDGAEVIVVRSQEIDHAGEAGFAIQARQIMDTVVDNVARAVRRLASLGVAHAVVTADHGHLFFAADRDESMRIDAPGGKTTDLHRRCWAGRGGSTPAAATRVTGAQLGYDTDLDFIFPTGSALFRAGGDLAYCHGGTSLQELVVPVVSIRTPTASPPRTVGQPTVTVSGAPAAVTNRVFTVTVTRGGRQLTLGASPLPVTPMLLAGGRQVGTVGMVVDGSLDKATGIVTLDSDRPATVAFLLSDDSVSSVRLVVVDPTTDAELYRSPDEIPVKLGL
jgi:hypothetical protein